MKSTGIEQPFNPVYQPGHHEKKKQETASLLDEARKRATSRGDNLAPLDDLAKHLK